MVCEDGNPPDHLVLSEKFPLAPVQLMNVCADKPAHSAANSSDATNLGRPAGIGYGMPPGCTVCKWETPGKPVIAPSAKQRGAAVDIIGGARDEGGLVGA